MSQFRPVPSVRPLAALTLVAAAVAVPLAGSPAVAAPVPAAFAARAAHAAGDASQGDAEVVGDHLPVQIHVGATSVELPLWLKLSDPRKSVTVALASGDDEIGRTTLTNDDPDTEFKGTLNIRTRDIKRWGQYRWKVEPEDGKEYTLGAKVRSHSQLGLDAERDDDEVKITGSLRAYHSVMETYKPWKGRRVLVQRWDGDDWVTVRSLTTDKHGEIEATIKLDWTVSLRLTTTTSSKIWGATSNDVLL